jgi:RNA chaperone Hfq
MNNRTPMVVVLDNGDQLRGHIEWYDRNCLKVNREGAPNLLVYKHAIRYMYKQEEEGGAPETPDQVRDLAQARLGDRDHRRVKAGPAATIDPVLK